MEGDTMKHTANEMKIMQEYEEAVSDSKTKRNYIVSAYKKRK